MSDGARRATAGLITVLLAVIVVLGFVVGEPTTQDRTQAIGNRIKCPVCQGEAITDSPSETARAMLDVVAEQVDAGRTNDEIYEYFRDRYGDGILLDPSFQVRTVALWLLPLAAVMGGVVLILRRRQAPLEAGDSSRPGLGDRT